MSNPTKLTQAELEAEWQVAFETRLGCLCGAGKPTQEQAVTASEEADEHVLALRLQS